MRKKRKKFWKPVVLGFVVLYLVSMGLATWLVKLKFDDEFKENAGWQLSSIRQRMENEVEEMPEETRKSYYQYFASQATSFVWHVAGPETSGKFQQFSVALYQTDGELLAKAEDVIGTTSYEETGTYYNYHTLDSLTREEIEQLAKYKQNTGNSMVEEPPKYRILMRVSKENRELCQILVQEITWTKKTEISGEMENYIDPITDGGHMYETVNGEQYSETDSKIVWERNYPNADEKTWESGQVKTQEVSLLFPYLAYCGYDQWQQWNKSEYLQGFERQIDITEDKIEDILTTFSDYSYRIKGKDNLYTTIWDVKTWEPICYLALRFESHPWLAAIDYLKYAYLMGFVLMFACIVKLIYVTNKTYEQRAAVEEMRRDFTNAMAHELKTPLGIIRGFAENLQEHNMEEKRDYYLTQIIGQTEEMDRLVAEMIAISKMDSEQLVLQKESISMSELIQEQFQRLEPMIQEKHLQIIYECSEDFIIEGDPCYLAKAIWNLLSNAVIYNILDGSILVQTNARQCIIENTGGPLTEEQLTHAFDMFYSGDKSRSSKDKHMGMGLFLAKKILGLHGLMISLENSRTGVRVMIEK